MLDWTFAIVSNHLHKNNSFWIFVQACRPRDEDVDEDVDVDVEIRGIGPSRNRFPSTPDLGTHFQR